MKILIISQYAGSSEHGMVIRNYNWATELKSRNHQVTLIAGSFSHSRQKNPDIGTGEIATHSINGLRYIWLKVKPYKASSNIARVRAMVSFTLRLSHVLKRLKNTNYDLVIASSPQPFIIYSAYSFAKRCGAKLIYDIRDLWPLTLKELGNISGWHPFIVAMQHAEDFACRNADLITAVPQNCKRYLISRGMKEKKFLHIGNGYLQKTTAPSPLLQTHARKLDQLKKEDKLLIGYCGALGRANSMHTAIQALAKCESKKIHLIMVGDGPFKDQLINLAHELNLQSRVHFLMPIPHDRIDDFLSRINVAYISGIRSKLYEYGCSPTKMNDYMAAAKPIIYGMGDPNNPVEQSGGGIVCDAENETQVAQAMDRFAKMQTSDLNAIGTLGRNWLIKHQTVNAQIDAILTRLSDAAY